MSNGFRDGRTPSYLSIAAADRPLRSPVPAATVAAAGRHRRGRLVEQLAAAGCDAILLYDPISIRYALEVANMQVWMAHNPLHYAVVCADGYAVDWSYKGSEHLAGSSTLVDESRTAISWFFMISGQDVEPNARRWAAEIADVVASHGSGTRLAVDRCDGPGARALEEHGLTVVEGQPLTERARLVKSADEIELMRWTLAVCDACIHRVHEASAEPGRTEAEIWAELHHENIRNGGGWVETRLLASGPRTNPWFQETSDRVTEVGDLLAFDTDLIGPYGYCADVSRSWTVGHVPPTPAQRDLYRHAREQVEHNVALLRPGLEARELNERSYRMPQRLLGENYGIVLHGVGMADEYPFFPLWFAYEGSALQRSGFTFEPGMVVCVESLVGERGGREAVKLETQVLITENGAERLDRFPLQDW
jgi:Xaa-Pro aminopeptidase